jgi:putative spermidine/putrescine transport system substrate-binding protein
MRKRVGSFTFAVLFAILFTSGALAQTLTFVSWGGAYQEAQTRAFLEPYMQETGINIVQDGPTEYAQLMAMVEAGQVFWDVVNIENDFGLSECDVYLEPLDYTIIPRDEILEGFADECRVAAILYASVLAYRTDQLTETPQGWADFFDLERFPGNRGMPRNPSRFTLEVALIADGVPQEELYPLDVERALAKLDTIKDNIVWWETGAQSVQHIADGEVAMSMIWNGRVQVAIDEGAPISIQWNEHIALADYLTVAKGSPNRDEAMRLIAYMVSAENNHRIAEHISYAPTNVNSFERVNPEIADTLPTFADRPQQALRVSDAWWDANREATVERFNLWLIQ